MSKYIYIQNHKLEYLAGFELGLPIWVSRMSSKKSDALDSSTEKYAALDFSTEKYAAFAAGLCGITDFHITVTTTRHFVAELCGITDFRISVTATRHYE